MVMIMGCTKLLEPSKSTNIQGKWPTKIKTSNANELSLKLKFTEGTEYELNKNGQIIDIMCCSTAIICYNVLSCVICPTCSNPIQKRFSDNEYIETGDKYCIITKSHTRSRVFGIKNTEANEIHVFCRQANVQQIWRIHQSDIPYSQDRWSISQGCSRFMKIGGTQTETQRCHWPSRWGITRDSSIPWRLHESARQLR